MISNIHNPLRRLRRLIKQLYGIHRLRHRSTLGPLRLVIGASVVYDPGWIDTVNRAPQ